MQKELKITLQFVIEDGFVSVLHPQNGKISNYQFLVSKSPPQFSIVPLNTYIIKKQRVIFMISISIFMNNMEILRVKLKLRRIYLRGTLLFLHCFFEKLGVSKIRLWNQLTDSIFQKKMFFSSSLPPPYFFLPPKPYLASEITTYI